MSLIQIRNRIETGFEAYGAWVVRHRWAMLLACLALIAASMARLPDMRFDNSTEGFLRDDDPTKGLYQEFRRQFGSDHQIMVAVSPPDVFDLSFLAKLRDFHQDLERSVPHIEDITSLLNARDTRGEEDSLIVGELLEDWPENQQDLDALRERVIGNPLFLDNLVSRDMTTTTLTLTPVTYSGTEFDAPQQ
jgi:predicted RND superfamily exporter protein